MSAARTAALARIFRSWNALDNGLITQDEYDRTNAEAAAVLGADEAEALSTLTVQERWSSDDAARAAADPADLAATLARIDAATAATDAERDRAALDALAAFWTSQAGVVGDGECEGDGDVDGGDAVNAVALALLNAGRLVGRLA